jgi:hypothetical protein
MPVSHAPLNSRHHGALQVIAGDGEVEGTATSGAGAEGGRDLDRNFKSLKAEISEVRSSTNEKLSAISSEIRALSDMVIRSLSEPRAVNVPPTGGTPAKEQQQQQQSNFHAAGNGATGTASRTAPTPIIRLPPLSAPPPQPSYGTGRDYTPFGTPVRGNVGVEGAYQGAYDPDGAGLNDSAVDFGTA